MDGGRVVSCRHGPVVVGVGVGGRAEGRTLDATIRRGRLLQVVAGRGADEPLVAAKSMHQGSSSGRLRLLDAARLGAACKAREQVRVQEAGLEIKSRLRCNCMRGGVGKARAGS